MSKRRITILGMGPSAVERKVDIAKYCDTDEVWCLNNGYHNYAHVLPMFTRWFELHSWDYLKEWSEKESGARAIGADDHFDALDKLGCEVMCSVPLPTVRKQTRIDWVSVFTALQNPGAGRLAANYFLGSPSLMLALACWEHDRGAEIEEIRSWGIDTSDPTHAQQRQSWAYWCSQAHSRGIEMTGTALAFMHEGEKDGGLVGLREEIGDAIEKRRQADGSTDYVIASHYTDNEPYIGYAARLQADADKLGITLHLRKLPAAATWEEGADMATTSVMQTVREAMDEHGKPVIWTDVDDRLRKAPTLPEDLTFGYLQGAERQFYDKLGEPCLRYGAIFAVAPNECGMFCLDMAEQLQAKVTHHRAINGVVAATDRFAELNVQDITRHFRGCIEITPHGNRTQTCYT